jgi:hypothetical protein
MWPADRTPITWFSFIRFFCSSSCRRSKSWICRGDCAGLRAQLCLFCIAAITLGTEVSTFQTVIIETRKSLQNPGLPVVGMPDNWFAVPARTFYPIYPSGTNIAPLGLPEFYLIRNDYVADRIRNYKSTVAYIEKNYDLSLAHPFWGLRSRRSRNLSLSKKALGLKRPRPPGAC